MGSSAQLASDFSVFCEPHFRRVVTIHRTASGQHEDAASSLSGGCHHRLLARKVADKTERKASGAKREQHKRPGSVARGIAAAMSQMQARLPRDKGAAERNGVDECMPEQLRGSVAGTPPNLILPGDVMGRDGALGIALLQEQDLPINTWTRMTISPVTPSPRANFLLSAPPFSGASSSANSPPTPTPSPTISHFSGENPLPNTRSSGMASTLTTEPISADIDNAEEEEEDLVPFFDDLDSTDDFGMEEMGTVSVACFSFSHPSSHEARTRDTAAEADAKAAATSTLLGHLPVDILENVVRHMSDRPRHSHWERYIAHAHLHRLLTGHGLLSDISRAKVTGLRVSNKDQFSGQLPTARWDAHLPSLLAATGPNLTRLRLSVRAATVSAVKSAWFDGLSDFCPRLAHLSITGLADDGLFVHLLAARSGRLKTLDADCNYSRARIAAIASHASGVRRLEVVRPAGDLDGMLATVGPTLHDLSVTFVLPRTGQPQALAALQRHCGHLAHVKLRGVLASVAGPLARLCISLGPRLRRVLLPSMGAPLLRQVADACVGARVKIKCSAETLVHTMESLGPRLAALTYTPGRTRMIVVPAAAAAQEAALRVLPVDAAVAAEGCRNLETIVAKELGKNAAAMVRALLGKPKRRLYGVELSLVGEGAGEVMAVLAETTGRVRNFTFAGVLPEKGVFDAFAEANPKMARVKIRLRGKFQEGEGESSCVDAINAFGQCRDLRMLSISRTDEIEHGAARNEAIADACVRFRMRCMRVEAFGVHYLS